jgi:hypothetical protein
MKIMIFETELRKKFYNLEARRPGLEDPEGPEVLILCFFTWYSK